MFRRKAKGFTLIELLVVIAIIGILATIVLVSLNTARQKARDTARISDLRQVVLALEMYYDDEQAYPATTGANAGARWADLGTALQTKYITAVPTDPSAGQSYDYQDCANSQDYALGATLEDTGHNALATDVDAPGCAVDPDGGLDSCDDAVSGTCTDCSDYCIQL